MAVDNTSNIEIGKRIKIIMNENKLTYRSLSKALNPDGVIAQGTSYVSLHNVVKGEFPISVTLLNALRKHFGYSQQWITTGIGEKKAVREKRMTLTDIDALKLEIDSQQAIVKRVEMRLSYQEKEITELKRMLKDVCQQLLSLRQK